MSTMVAPTTPSRPVEIERFRRADLVFEADGDMSLNLRPFGSGKFEQGAVVVLLNVDGESYDHVMVEQQNDPLQQLDLAIEALTEARDELRRMHGR